MATTPTRAQLDERAKSLDERESALERAAGELETRERTLAARELRVRHDEDSSNARNEILNERESALDARARALDERESALAEMAQRATAAAASGAAVDTAVIGNGQRKIHGSIAHPNGELYGPGREGELERLLSPAQVMDLMRRELISGAWRPGQADAGK